MKILSVLGVIFVSLMLVANFGVPAACGKVIFFATPSKEPTTLKGQLFIAPERSIRCPRGHIRDHRNRCRRAMVFGKR